MVLVNIKSTNGGKAKAASRARHVTSVAKARETIRAGQRGIVRTSGYYGKFPQGQTVSGGELKFFDLDIDDAVVAASGVIAQDSCNKIAQGVTEVQRVGRKCTIKAVNWRYLLILPQQDAQATPAPGESIRVIVYLDKQCNGATATNTGILESADFQSFNNLANKNRFTILMDKTHSVNYNTLGSDGAGVISSNQVLKNYQWYKKCNIPIEFDAATGAITEIRSNNIGVLLVSQNGTVGFFSKMRLRFTDH